MSFLVFEINSQLYGIDCNQIDRVIEAVFISENSRFRGSFGVVNINGASIPVIDVRSLLNLEEKELELSDLMVILKKGDKKSLFLVDRTISVVDQKSLKLELEDKEDIILHTTELNEQTLFILNIEILFAYQDIKLEKQWKRVK